MRPDFPGPSNRAKYMRELVEWMKEHGVSRVSFPDGVHAHGKQLAAFRIELARPPAPAPVVNVTVPRCDDGSDEE